MTPLRSQLMKLFCERTALVVNKKIELRPALISIKGSQIESVQEWRKEESELPANTVVLKNKMLTPAFINAHTHLAMSFFRGIDLGASAGGNMVTDFFFKVESKLSAEDVRAFTRMGAYEALLFGVGTVWDHYYHGEAVAQGLCDVGLTGVVAPTLQDLEGPGKDVWEREWHNTENIHNSKEFAKRGIVAAWGPHATDTVSAKLWKKIQEAATKNPMPIHFHLAQSREEFHKRMASENLTPVKFLARTGIFDIKSPLVLAHGVYLRDDDMSLLAQHSNSNLVFCPFSQMIFDFPANVMEWERHNLNWLIATDTVASNDSMNVQKELRTVSGFPMQALSYSQSYKKFSKEHSTLEELCTERDSIWKKSEHFRDPSFLLSKVWHKAGTLHPQLKVGSIAPDAFANLIVWDLDHPTFWPAKNLRALCFNDSTSAIYNMMIGGKWMSKDASFTESICASSEYKSSLKEAKERLSIILKSL